MSAEQWSFHLGSCERIFWIHTRHIGIHGCEEGETRSQKMLRGLCVSKLEPRLTRRIIAMNATTFIPPTVYITHPAF